MVSLKSCKVSNQILSQAFVTEILFRQLRQVQKIHWELKQLITNARELHEEIVQDGTNEPVSAFYTLNCFSLKDIHGWIFTDACFLRATNISTCRDRRQDFRTPRYSRPETNIASWTRRNARRKFPIKCWIASEWTCDDDYLAWRV